MSNKTKIYIVDFEDSFTYNIANILYPYCQQLQVINYKEFFKDYFQKNIEEDRVAIILGPGPGHPVQYQEYYRQISSLLQKNNLYLMGICLGHQLLASQAGYKIILSANPIHGKIVRLFWNNRHYSVQRYNSLAVEARLKESEISIDNEVMILSYKNGRSYQFHPESVGTEHSAYFFSDLLSFIQSS
jgi:anthranilate/para-aminobenzoate synthase component II